jgi:hypothetical protein
VKSAARKLWKKKLMIFQTLKRKSKSDSPHRQFGVSSFVFLFFFSCPLFNRTIPYLFLIGFHYCNTSIY